VLGVSFETNFDQPYLAMEPKWSGSMEVHLHGLYDFQRGVSAIYYSCVDRKIVFRYRQPDPRVPLDCLEYILEQHQTPSKQHRPDAPDLRREQAYNLVLHHFLDKYRGPITSFLVGPLDNIVRSYLIPTPPQLDDASVLVNHFHGFASTVHRVDAADAKQVLITATPVGVAAYPFAKLDTSQVPDVRLIPVRVRDLVDKKTARVYHYAPAECYDNPDHVLAVVDSDQGHMYVKYDTDLSAKGIRAYHTYIYTRPGKVIEFVFLYPTRYGSSPSLLPSIV
jgi:hypothetical protein